MKEHKNKKEEFKINKTKSEIKEQIVEIKKLIDRNNKVYSVDIKSCNENIVGL